MKLLYNAHIHTQNPSQPTASALVIDRERIIEVGNADDLFKQYPNAERQDMNERIIVPGLTDISNIIRWLCKRSIAKQTQKQNVCAELLNAR